MPTSSFHLTKVCSVDILPFRIAPRHQFTLLVFFFAMLGLSQTSARHQHFFLLRAGSRVRNRRAPTAAFSLFDHSPPMTARGINPLRCPREPPRPQKRWQAVRPLSVSTLSDQNPAALPQDGSRGSGSGSNGGEAMAAAQRHHAAFFGQEADHASTVGSSYDGAAGNNAVTRSEYYELDPSLRERVTIVRTPAEARTALAALYAATELGAVHGCDTEVADIDLKQVGPVGNGYVTCVSIFSGPAIDYGDGPGKALWVDNLDEAEGVLLEFKEWFEDATQPKVWHNYGFDRHVMHNDGVDCLGFAGDTMHMARLADSSRDKRTGAGAGYSLEALTHDLVGRRKVPMKELFGVAKLLKNGAESKVKVLPPIEDLQRGTVKATHRADFIRYSGYDAEGTWLLHQALNDKLEKMPWVGGHTMRDYYELILVPFGETLTDMERRGILVDAKDYLASLQVQATKDREACLAAFRSWLLEVAGPDGAHFNPQSATQMQTLLFGGAQNAKKGGDRLPTERIILVPLTEDEAAELEAFESEVVLARQAENEQQLMLKTIAAAKDDSRGESAPASVVGTATAKRAGDDSILAGLTAEAVAGMKVAELKAVCKAGGLKVSGKKAELQDRIGDLMAAQPERFAVDSFSHGETAVEGSGEVVNGSAGANASSIALAPNSEDEMALAVDDAYAAMSTETLRDALRVRSLEATGGQRAVLLRRLRDDDQYSKALINGYHRQHFKQQQPQRSQALPPQQWRQQQQQQDRPIAMAQHATMEQRTPTVKPVNVATNVALTQTRGHVEGENMDENDESEDSAPEGMDAEYYRRMRTKFAAVKGRTGAKRSWQITIRSLGLTPVKFTPAGLPSVTMDVLRSLAGKQKLDGRTLDEEQLGSANSFFGGGEAGLSACRALDALCRMGSIDTMLASFIEPLQKLADENSRVHCSLNLNTETGRLSARRPNLQNQPALEKDQYRIRDAFTCEPGNQLIVADYGQLELRLLAHITNCRSMIDAFEGGGCFHSRTAVGMFDHVREAVERGDVLLEWDYAKGEPPAPLVKDVYGSERRKAKTLNFSIAYGKTPHGLSKDWGVSVKEAEELLEAWYADRPEVKVWQQRVIKEAKRTGSTRTLMGRYRTLNDITSPKMGPRGHAERAAINTPIQGGAADIVMLAMNKINRSPVLDRLGYKLLLQVHDEVIVEGPEEHVEEALREVVHCMEEPWDDSGIGLNSLKVHLDVDAKHAKTWYAAK